MLWMLAVIRDLPLLDLVAGQTLVCRPTHWEPFLVLGAEERPLPATYAQVRGALDAGYLIPLSAAEASRDLQRWHPVLRLVS